MYPISKTQGNIFIVFGGGVDFEGTDVEVWP